MFKRNGYRARLVAALLLAAPVGVCGSGLMTTSAEYTVYVGVETDLAHSIQLDVAHVDLDISYFGGAGNLQLNVSSSFGSNPANDVVYQLDEAYLYCNVNDRQMLSQAAIDAGWGVIGAAAGETYWSISQFSGSNDSIFLGIASTFDFNNELVQWNPGDASKGANRMNKWLCLELVSVDGPVGGDVTIYIFSGISPLAFIATSDGIDGDDTVYLSAGGHDHFNWAFSKQGVYAITFRVTTAVVENYGNWTWTAGLDGSGSLFGDEQPNGLSNGLYYALELPFTGNAYNALPQTVNAGGAASVDLELPENARADMTYTLWRRDDLLNGNWVAVATKEGTNAWNSAQVSSVGTANGRMTYRYTDPAPMADDASVTFRLGVTESSN
ncbi:MAG: choice-of-anchor M domain-containing protein [Verrucomicrobiota bacterium]